MTTLKHNVELTKEQIDWLLYTIDAYIFESGNESEDILSLKEKLSSYIHLEYDLTSDWECSSGTLHAYNENCDCNDF